jgi:hypothetical protein
MLKWPDVLNLARNGNPAPDRRLEKTEALVAKAVKR